jgi:hypothetical protein
LRALDFEWLMSAALALGWSEPRLHGGVAYLPVHLDDYPLWTGRDDLTSWLSRLDQLLAEQSYVAVGLHDCYAQCWLDAYPHLLAHLGRRARIVTAEQVAAETYLAAAWSQQPAGAA